MDLKDRFNKLNLSGIGSKLGKTVVNFAARMGAKVRQTLQRQKSQNPLTSTSTSDPTPIAGGFKARLGARISTTAAELRAHASNIATTIKNKFPKNLEELRRLQSDEALDRVRALLSGRNAATYLRLGAAAFAAYFLADTVSLFTDSLIPDAPPVPAPRMSRKMEKRRSIEEYASILQRNIFNSQGIIPETEIAGSGPARKTSLPFNLVGTVVLQDELKSIAAIEDKSQNLVFPVRVEDTISDKAKITKIERFRVYFINRSSGYLEYVEIIEDLPVLTTAPLRSSSTIAPKSEGGITKTSETNFEIQSEVVNNAISNFSEVLQQARAIPNFENGMPDGYKLIQIVPNSIYAKLGMVNGDVICGINDEPINDAGKAFQFFNELKSAKHFDICVKRGGRKMTMNYDIR